MNVTSASQRALGILALFTLAAGDFWRYLLGWWGWGAIVVTIVTLAILQLVRARVDVRRLPFTLLTFVLLAYASAIWSAYPLETLLGATTTAATIALGVFVAVTFTWDEVRGMLTATFRWIIGLSLGFELFVSLVIRERVLPFWVDYSHLDKIPASFYWSRNLLLDGGRIQGIVGNANLLGMIAVLALLLFALRLILRKGSPIWGWFWVIAAAATVALTRSSTSLVALAAMLFVIGYLVVVHRVPPRAHFAVHVSAVLLAAAGVVGVLVFRAPLLGLLGKSNDLTNRFDIWQTVWGLAVERPAAGWGWISYWAPWVEPYAGLVEIRGVTYLQAHNAWLDVFLQLGVTGLIVFGLWVATTLTRSWLLAIDTDGVRADSHGLRWPASALPYVLLVGLLVQSLAESRLLIEIGLVLLVVISVKTSWADTVDDDRVPPLSHAGPR